MYECRCLGKMAKSGATRIFENLIKVDDIDVNHRTIVTFTFF